MKLIKHIKIINLENKEEHSNDLDVILDDFIDYKSFKYNDNEFKVEFIIYEDKVMMSRISEDVEIQLDFDNNNISKGKIITINGVINIETKVCKYVVNDMGIILEYKLLIDNDEFEHIRVLMKTVEVH